MKTTPKKTLTDLITKFPKEKSDKTALVFLDKTGKAYQEFSFENLKKQCYNIAQNLLAVSPEKETVLLAIEDQAKFVTAFFACLLTGKIPAPIPSIRSKRNKQGWGRALQILQANENVSLLIEAHQYDFVAQGLKEQNLQKVQVYTIEKLELPATTNHPLPEIQVSDIAYIQYTSGSTAKPKGIMLSHEQVINNLTRMYRVFNRGELVKVAGWIPFYHDMGLVGHLFTALFESGLGVFLPPSAFLANPGLWFDAIDKYKANSAAAPTFAFEHCFRKIKEDKQWDLSSWKNAYVGSETVTLEILDQFSDRFSTMGFDRNTFKPVYGLAETTLLAAGGNMGLSELDDFHISRDIGRNKKRVLLPYSIDPATEISIHK